MISSVSPSSTHLIMFSKETFLLNIHAFRNPGHVEIDYSVILTKYATII